MSDGAAQIDVARHPDVEGIETSEGVLGTTAADVAELLQQSGEWAVTTDPISDGSVSWLPHARSSDGDVVVHVHLADELRSYLRQRLAMAVAAGCRLVIALRLQSLYQSQVVEFLSEVDAEVMVVDDIDGLDVAAPEHLMAALSDRSVPVEHSVRTKVAQRAWERRADGTSYAKGRRFEGLLAFLFGQVGDFRVVERNLRGASDEVDLVIQVDNWSDRCWQQSGAPFVIVEAKNRADPVDQATVTVLNGKLRTKRQSVRLGFLVTTGSFTADARMQELKFAQDSEVIVMIDGDGLVEWIESEEPDEVLERIVRRAMLR